MRIRLLYPFLAFVLTSSAWGGPELKRDLNLGEEQDSTEEVSVEPSLVKFRFDQEIKKLERLVSQNRDSISKVSLLKDALKEIQNLRDSLGRADLDEEIYMNIVVRSLDEIPEPKDFHQKRCPAYQSQMIVNFEPTADENGPIDPAVRKAYNILRRICN